MDFSKIGLNGRDKRVYEALLLSPRSSVRAIAEETGINRGSVFESIKALTEVGLVSYTHSGKRRHYHAQSPEVLHEIVVARRRELKLAHTGIDSYIEKLSLGEKFDKEMVQFASFYEGFDGMASILRDVLGTLSGQGASEYYSISSPRVSEVLYTSYPGYTRERIKRGISVKVIDLRDHKIPAKDALAERKPMASERVDNGVYTLIYGSKVAIIRIDKYRNINGIVIEDEAIASLQGLLFEQVWQLLI